MAVINIMKDGTIRQSMKGISITKESNPEVVELLKRHTKRTGEVVK